MIIQTPRIDQIIWPIWFLRCHKSAPNVETDKEPQVLMQKSKYDLVDIVKPCEGKLMTGIEGYNLFRKK